MNIKFITEQEYSHLLGLIEKMNNNIETLSKKQKTSDFDFLNTQEVCLLLGISKRSLANYSSSGLLKSTKLNGLCYYSKSEIIKLLNDNMK